MGTQLTIASVDNTTEQITITAHGLNTGDGPVAIYSAAGTLPAPLAAVTDYWVIKISANVIQLATSSANALANTPINLTTNGSGTLLLLIGLPYRRPRTAAALTQVFSADSNNTWDALVAIWNYVTGQAQSVFGDLVLAAGKNLVVGGTAAVTGLITATAGLTAAANQHLTVSGTGQFKHGTRTMVLPVSQGSGGYQVGSGIMSGPGTLQSWVVVPLDIGKRILAVRAYIKDSATGPTKVACDFSSMVPSVGTAVTQLATQLSSGAGTFQTLTLSALNRTVASGTLYLVGIYDAGGGAASVQGFNVEVDYDHP